MPTARNAPLPLPHDYAPMEAKLVDELPTGPEWQYEPKWDGFRCLAFRNGAEVELMSKAGKPLSRYFPELVELLGAVPARRFVIDGEIVVPSGDSLSFDDLLLRIHPAQSRIARLASGSPASFVVFDMLVDDTGESIVGAPLVARRAALESFFARHAGATPQRKSRLLLSPVTGSMTKVTEWFRSVGGGLDGVIAKRLDLEYQTGERTGMVKMKAMRTADCVVGGFRYASKGGIVGSLLLGLHDADGLLHHVGFTSNIPNADKTDVTRRLERIIAEPGFTGQAPGGPSRWSTERSTQWKPLAPTLVVEVKYDHFSGGRFRHGTSFLRWRPDKAPAQCTLAQVEAEERSALALLG